MGMFDYIVNLPEIKCRKCGAILTGWQSKDGPCTLEEIPYWTVDEFYTSCAACGKWHRYYIDRPREVIPFEMYKLMDESISNDAI